LLSFAFLIVPNFNPFRDGEGLEETKTIPIPGKSRNLLHKSTADEFGTMDENPYGITVKPPAFWEQPQTPVMDNFKEIVDDIEIDGVEQVIDSTPMDTDTLSAPRKEQIVYVQIEQTKQDPINVTYVSSEADYKMDHNYDTTSKAPPVHTGSDDGGQQKQKHDL